MIINRDVTYYKTLTALALGSVAVFGNIYCVQPLLPQIAKQFNLGLLEATGALTVTTLALAFALLIYGAISETLGRYPILLFSLGANLLITLILPFSDSFGLLLWMRAAQGVALAALPAVAIAYVGEEFSPHLVPGVVGVYIAANTIGGISGRIVGGLVTQWFEWHMMFWFLSAFNLITLVITWRWLTRPANFVSRPFSLSNTIKDLGHHLSYRPLIGVYLAIGLAFGVFINLYSYLSFLLVEPPYNKGPAFIGTLFLTYLAGTLASALAGLVTRRLSFIYTMLTGLLIFLAGILVLSHQNLSIIILGLAINAFGFFLTHSVASGWVNRMATRAKAIASSGYLLFYYIGASIGPMLLYPFWQHGGWHGTLAGAAGYLLLACLSLIWVSRSQVVRQAGN